MTPNSNAISLASGASCDIGDGVESLSDDNLYTELLHSSEALEAFLSDLKDNPKKYVHFSLFGRKDKSKKKE